MINTQWLELPMSRKNFHGPKDVRATEVRLYYGWLVLGLTAQSTLLSLFQASQQTQIHKKLFTSVSRRIG